MYLERRSGLKPGDGADTKHEHHWVVFSTVLQEALPAGRVRGMRGDWIGGRPDARGVGRGRLRGDACHARRVSAGPIGAGRRKGPGLITRASSPPRPRTPGPGR